MFWISDVFAGRVLGPGVLEARVAVAGRDVAAVVAEGEGADRGGAGGEGVGAEREPVRALLHAEVRALHLQEGQGRLGQGEPHISVE